MHKREGSIKRGVQLNSGSLAAAVLSSGYLGTHFRVFLKPQTLYLGCLGASRVGSIIQTFSVACFINKWTSWPFWRTLSYYDFICLMVTKVDHYFLPWNLVLSEAWISTHR